MMVVREASCTNTCSRPTASAVTAAAAVAVGVFPDSFALLPELF
jgi:hypothetical protein